MIPWPEIARCFAVLRPVEWIDRKALAHLQHLQEDKPVMVACSGGADSVFLTLVMLSLLGSDRLRVAHFNHGIRGGSADADEAFVKAMCEGLGIRFLSGRPGGPLDPSEASLREARYSWLESVYRKKSAGALVLGQHADDLLESQVMALFSGAGPSGMVSPEPVRIFPDGHVRLRPLLPMKRSTIETTLRSLEIPWQEDPSNLDNGYTRNWVRNELLPQVVKRIPQDLHATSQRTRLLMSETLGVVDELLEQLGLDYSDPTGLDVRLLVHRQPGLIRRALMGWWIRHSPQNQLGSAATDTIIGHVQSGRADQPVSVGPYPAGGDHLHVCVLTRTGRLEIRPESLAEPVAWTSGCHWNWRAGPLYLPDGSLMEAEPVRWPAGEEPFLRADPRREAWLVGVDGPLFVRQWRSGDKYRPLGAPGRRKLQDLFTDAKLGAEQKNTLPVILDSEGEILWVPGFPPAERARVGPADNTALRLTYREHLTAFPPEHVG